MKEQWKYYVIQSEYALVVSELKTCKSKTFYDQKLADTQRTSNKRLFPA